MQINNTVQKLSSHPIPHQVMMEVLRHYKRPNDKIHSLIREKNLIVLKRGLYVWNSDLMPENFSIANALYAPSYISAESALAFYGLIPERVFATVSMSIKPPRKFINEIGKFEFLKLPIPYYAFGIKRTQLREDQFSIIATPEKALMDKVVTTFGILLRSEKSARKFLVENLRMEEKELKLFNTQKMRKWAESAPKKDSLNHMANAIENL